MSALAPSEEVGVETLNRLASAGWVARCLHVVADLGVADALGDTPLAPQVLAQAVGAHPGALSRVMRLLASAGVFEDLGGRFGHSPASRLLRADHPQSFRAYVRMMGLPMHWASYGALELTVRTGKPASAHAASGNGFEYFAAHPEEARIFDEAMTAKSHGQIAEIMGHYDFSPFARIADVGGGRGHLLRAVLAAAPNARGVLFDLPHVVARAAGPPSARLSLQAGDFFQGPLPACDLYLLMNVLHDWADEEVLTIVRTVRAAAPRQARVLVLESIIPERPGPHHAKLMDVEMLVMTTGRERTAAEFTQLLGAGGFVVSKVIDTGGRTSIIEASAR